MDLQLFLINFVHFHPFLTVLVAIDCLIGFFVSMRLIADPLAEGLEFKWTFIPFFILFPISIVVFAIALILAIFIAIVEAIVDLLS